MNLIQALERERHTQGLTLQQMADRLTVNKRYYQKLVAGDRSPGVTILAAVIQQFPTLHVFVDAFLATKPLATNV